MWAMLLALSMANAKDPIKRVDVVAGLQVGWGGELETSDIDVYGLMGSAYLGAKIKVLLPWYAGLRADLFSGGDLANFTLDSIEYDIRQNASQLVAEFGIEPHIGPLSIRPTVGVGAARIAGQLCQINDGNDCTVSNDGGFVASFAVQAGLQIFRPLEVTAFARFNNMAGRFEPSLSNGAALLGGGLGLRF